MVPVGASGLVPSSTPVAVGIVTILVEKFMCNPVLIINLRNEIMFICGGRLL